MQINMEDVRPINLTHYQADASELGFPVGETPRTLYAPNIGNQQPFRLTKTIRNTVTGDTDFFIFMQSGSNIELRVFND
jgi:hypothetical protein